VAFSSGRQRRAAVLVGVLLVGAGPSEMGAKVLRERPLVFGDGRLAVAGDVSAGFSCARGQTIRGCGKDLGWFNYTGYNDSLLRLFRVNVSAAVKASQRVSVLTEIRSDNLRRAESYALYVRVRPWLGPRFDIQAGRIPPSFGAFRVVRTPLTTC
jgi:hypothetical protein